MKILRVINSLEMGGAERSIETNVPVHISNGFDMDVLLLNGTETPFMKNLKNSGVEIFMTSSKMSIYNPLQIVKVIPFLKRYDIIHVHLFPALYWVALAKFISFSKVKLVYTEHSTSNNRRGKFIFKIADKFIYSFYTTIISISAATHENLLKHLGKGNIVTIDNGVNLQPFENPNPKFIRETINIKRDCFVLTQIASLREPKDQDTVIKALSLLPSDCEFLIVGNGGRRTILEELAVEFGVSERVHFLGTVTEIPEIVNLSDIVIMSSQYEGFGRAAIEGMAGGKPLIATDVEGLRDLVSGAGLLFKTGDYHTLANEILRLKNDKAFYEQTSRKCKERAQLYSADKMIRGYEDIYNKVIALKKR